MGNNVCEIPEVQRDFMKDNAKYLDNRVKDKSGYEEEKQKRNKRKQYLDDYAQYRKNKSNNQIVDGKIEQIQKIDIMDMKTRENYFSVNDIQEGIPNQQTNKFKQKEQSLLKNRLMKQQKQRISQKQISLPFQFVQTVLSKQMLNIMCQQNPKFIKKYFNDKIRFKINKNGFYQHFITSDYGIFINQGYIYEGSFKSDQKGDIFPSGRGKFLTKQGKYVGQIENGLPDGKGKYYEFGLQNIECQNFTQNKRSKTGIDKNYLPISIDLKLKISKIYDGEWKNGCFIKGTVQNDSFYFKGELKNGKPHGNGELDFKKTNIHYQGQFKNGLFDGQKGNYETNQYRYSGNFKSGHKNGYGVLQIKEKKQINKKYTKIIQQKYQGKWINDKLVSHSKLNEIFR